MPSRKGFLRKYSLDKNPLDNEPEEKFCVLKNKSLKWYSDGPRMMEIEGVIDFDFVKCLIMVEEKYQEQNESYINTESSNILTEVAEARTEI